MDFSSSGDSMPVTEEFTPLARPSQSSVNIDLNHKSCPSESFNYPTFRLVNKKTRIYLSEPFTSDLLTTYHPLAIANTKGWFAAVRRIGGAQDIILSPLEELRNSVQKANEDEEGYFFPKRDLNVDAGIPTIVAFAHSDTRLIVGTNGGSICVYDTAGLFSSGSDSVTPLRTYNAQPGTLQQISPNPGTDSDLIDIIAVVRSSGVVHLMNTMLESLGGWSTAEPNASPIAVSWSPKGKHLAIGLQTGDILTFALNNKSIPNKHIPATAEGRLVGLNWLSPGHTFRLSYAPQIENEGEPIQQIISLDTKSNSLTIFDTLHPFTMTDRQQQPHVIVLPHWDEDSVTESSKSLVVVGDRASVDLEILGGHSGQWHQQSQENPVSLPLDKQTEETTLMSLKTDLTDTSTLAPSIYAYLNDGSLQAWSLEHSKPYLPIQSLTVAQASTGGTLAATIDGVQDSAMDEKEAANVLTSLSNTNQPIPSSSTFGSSVGQPTFGATSQPVSVFGQVSSPTFGQPSAFGSFSSGSSTFGQTSAFGSSRSTTSVFGSTSSGSAYEGAFGGIASQRNTTNVFGSSSFGVNPSSASPSNQLAPPSDEMTREASMSDGTSSFGGLSLGGGSSNNTDNKASVFGSFGATPTSQAPASSTFGGVIKPAQGFGAFNNFGSAGPASSSTQEKPVVSAFSSPPQAPSHSAFEQSSFGKPAFGQTSFGQSGFGQTGFAKGPAATSSGSNAGGFAGFASSSPSSFASALQITKPTAPNTGGFSAFASGGATAFGSGVNQAPPVASDSVSPFGQKTEATGSPFTSDADRPSPFASGSLGAANAGKAFTNPTSGFELRDREATTTTTPQGSPVKPSAGMMSPPSSPEPSGSSPLLDSKKSVFSSHASTPSSSFLQKPTGFGALGAVPESSPFYKKPEAKAPVVTAFGSVGQTSGSKPLSSAATAPTFGSPSQLGSAGGTSTAAPTFGATSQLGTASKPTFGSTTPTTTPTKAPVSGGFGAFSSGTTSFSTLVGQTSFSQLLKIGGKDEKASGRTTSESTSPRDDETKAPSTPPKPISVFTPLSAQNTPSAPGTSGTPRTPTSSDLAKDEHGGSTTPKGQPGEKQPEPSPRPVSRSGSSLSSFVDVDADQSYEEDEKEEDENEGDDTRSFLSSDFSSEPSTEDEDSDEEGQTDEGKGKAVDAPSPSDGRSPSPTPQPEIPPVQVAPSPPAEAAKPSVSSSKEESTTPPGSPSNESKVPSKSPSPAPFSTPSTGSSTSPSPFGIGLGRPSTRPVRSSPLAAAPVSREDAEEEGQTKDKISRPATSADFSSELSSAEERIKQEDDSTTFKLPHTPILSSFEGLPTGKTSITPLAPKPEPAHSQTPPLLTGSPTPSLQPISVFSKPLESSSQVKEEPFRPVTTSVAENLPADRLAGTGIPQVSKTAPATPTGPPFSLAPFSLAPKSASTPQVNQVASSPASLPLKPPVFGQGSGSLFSTAPKVPTEAQHPSPGLFGAKAPSIPFSPQAGQSPMGAPQPPQNLPQKPAGAPSTSPFPVGIEEGLQKECYIVVKLMEDELKNLSELSARAAGKRQELSASTGGSRLKADLGVLNKWKISDATTFGQTLLQFEDNLVELKNIRDTFKQAVRELNGNMLKANTRREEIARFDKAKTDKEFAKMLSTRSLGPEHVEAQQQLRRSIRAIRDRVQKLESHLQDSKKKLSQAASGRPSIRAPTLDVVNRTYRNIDIAIQQQTGEIAKLTERVAGIKMSPASAPSPSRDARLPDQRRRSAAVTPHVAVTTAAALNAERSAHKLKKALLKVRKEPILNKKAASAPEPPFESESPRKPLAGSSIFGSGTGPLFSAPEAEAELPIPDIDFDLPEDNFNPGSPLPSSRRGAGSHPKKHGSVPLRKTPGGVTQSPPAPTSDFWGPLPAFTNPPLTKLAAEVKPVVPIVPLISTPSTPTPNSGTGSSSSLPSFAKWKI